MTAEQLMNRHPVVLRDTDTIGTAAEEIMSHRFRSLPVLDQDGRYLLCDRGHPLARPCQLATRCPEASRPRCLQPTGLNSPVRALVFARFGVRSY